MKPQALFAILIFLSLYACDKPYEDDFTDVRPTVAEGKIIDSTTGKGIPYVNVYLSVQPDGLAYTKGGNAMDFQKADAEGNFSFSFNADYGYTYYIDAEAPGYMSKPSHGSIEPGMSNKGMQVSLQPKGYIKFVLHSTSKDTLTSLSLPNKDLDMVAGDTTVYSFIEGGMQRTFSYSLTRKGSKDAQTYQDRIFVAPFDTAVYTINY